MAGLPIDYMAQKMEDFLVKEATLYGEARGRVEAMKQELMSMRSFLEDADDPQATSSKSKETQVAQVRDLVYDVEDIIDKYMYHINKWRGDHTFVWYFKRTVGFPKYFWERRQIATGLQTLNSMIKTIPERYQRYIVDRQESASGSNRGGTLFNSEAALFLNEDDLVGIEAPKEALVGFLTNGDLKRTTISVVGMGGSGKSTLVANLFNSPVVKQNFDCRAWITVSQTFNIEELLRSLIKEFNKSNTEEGIPTTELSVMSYRELLEKLVAYLEQKTYLVVLDDVWSIDVWIQIKVALPNGQKGSRVMLTTRMEDIALHCSSDAGSHIYNVKPLDRDKAWELFCRRAFSSRNFKTCSLELQDVANELIDKCEGLPLAITSVGGLLATKSCTLGAWTMVLKNLQWELSNSQMLQSTKSILLLSYNDLPYRLKCCFLYFALFPEDHRIWCDRLIRLWMAEGFVEAGENGVSPEEVGMRYIKELIGRNLLQAVRWEMFGDHGKCKMHDLYREIALTISKQEKFCSVYDARSLLREDNASNPRRLSIHQASSERDVATLVEGTSHVRSIFFFAGDNNFSLSKLPWSHLRLTRVVDMEESPLEKLSEQIAVLLNLKYLNLNNTMVKTLPKSIGKLWSLQTLEIVNTNIEVLPSEVVKLQNLRHLLSGNLDFGSLREYNILKGVKVPPGADISSLKNLQILRLVEASGEIVKQLKKMTQLVQLGITNLEGRAQMEDLCLSLQAMQLLRLLVVIACKEEEVLQMDSLNESISSSSSLQLLEYLILCGKLNNFPDWIRSLRSLTTVRLLWSRLPVEDDPVVHLQGMNSLRNVWFNNAYQGTELRFMTGFSNLRALALANLPNLEKLTIGEGGGVMPDLGILLIRDCPNLKMISGGIKCLTKLEDLRLENVSQELVERVRGEDRADFQHIPLITCQYCTSSGSYISERLVL